MRVKYDHIAGSNMLCELEFRKCMARCPRVDNLSEAQCEKRCERIYDEYVDKLKTRYEGVNKDKLNEVISGAESFTTKPREDRQGLLYKIFHW